MMHFQNIIRFGIFFTALFVAGAGGGPLCAAEAEPGPLGSSSIFASYDTPQVAAVPVSSDSTIAAMLAPVKDKNAGLNPLNPTVLGGDKPSSWLQTLHVENNRFTLVEGRSHFMKFSTRLSRISVSNPAILDFITLTSTEILLNAKANGSVDLIVWDAKGEMASFEINVIKDPGLLDQLLRNIDPKGKFEIFPSKNVFVVRGSTTTVQKQKFVDDAVKSFAPGSVSLVKVWAIRQILLQCRFVQIDHERNRSFGVDLESLREQRGRGTEFVRFLPGGESGATAEGGDTYTSNTAGSGDFSFDVEDLNSKNDADAFQYIFTNGDERLSAFLTAVEEEQIGKIIARPNLLAKDGEEASFLVGGERAIAITTNNEISVQYKDFGTKLKFKPEIMEDDSISLAIEPEVSDTSDALGTTIGTSVIPGFTKTSVKTQVQLSDGETLLLGGMIQQKLSTSDYGVPFLRRIPVIGKAFEKSGKNWIETELIIIVTPRIVQPDKQKMNQGAKNDVLQMATDYEKAAIPVDDHADAIKYYLEHNRRWVDKEEIKNTLYPEKEKLVPPVPETPRRKPILGGSVGVIASERSERSNLKKGYPERSGGSLDPSALPQDDVLRQIASSGSTSLTTPSLSKRDSSWMPDQVRHDKSKIPPGVVKKEETKKTSAIPPVTPSGWKKDSNVKYESPLFDSTGSSSDGIQP